MDDEFRTDEPALPIEQLLPVRSATVTLQFTGASQPKFFHQASLAAFVRHLLREPPDFDTLLRIHCLETGRTQFAPGDHYSFSVVSLAGGEALLSELIESLQMLPDSALRRERRICFRDNLRFIGLHDDFTGDAVKSAAELSVLDVVGYDATDLFWLDGIYSDPSSRDRGMGGLCGQLTLRDTNQLSADWWRLLALGQFTGIGQRTSQGWGRYTLGDEKIDWAARPATLKSTSPIRQIVADKNLLTAYYHCLFEQEQLGRVGELSPAEPEPALSDPVSVLRESFDALESMQYTVPEPQQFTARDHAPVAVPPLLDRVMQQATLQVLLPALTQLQASGRPQANSAELAQSFIDSQALHRRLDENPGVTLGSPLISLVGQPIGLQPIATDAWHELVGPQHRHHAQHRQQKGVRIRSRSPYRHYNTNPNKSRPKTGT